MIKVKSFFTVFYNSLLPQDRYYQKIVQSKFSFSLKYYLAFLSFCNFLFFSFILIIYLSPTKIIGHAFDIKKNLQTFPENLTIASNNGSLATTLDHPYFLRSIDEKKLLLVVDEFAAPEKIKDYNGQIMLTNKEVVLNGGKQLIKFPIGYLGKIDIGKSQINLLDKSLNTFLVIFPYIYVLLIVIGFLGFNLLSLGVTFSLITLASLIVLGVYKILKARFSFHRVLRLKKIIQVGLHAITLPVIIDYTFAFSNFSRLLPITYLLLITIFIFTGIYEAYFDHK